MSDDDLLRVVRSSLSEYVKSPSLTHIRDPYALSKLAQEIIKHVTGGNPIWRKWNPARETLLKSAVDCWIPTAELRDFLNEMPGPALTTTDVAQRLRAFYEEDYASYPDEALKPACLEIFGAEKAQGTEMPAIIGAIREFVEDESQRLFNERQEAWRLRREEERVALEQRFLSGADCKWTPVNRSVEVYCRVNARAYRLSRGADQLWNLHRIESVDDPPGELVGRYRGRGDATKALMQVAYQPEPRR